MNDLFAALRVSSFAPILAAYRAAGLPLDDRLDGGAGAGQTARVMLAGSPADTICYAFEPFPGNHRFFAGIDTRIRLIKHALADRKMTAMFQVSSIVGEDSEWGRRGMAGYSSVGYLTEKPRTDQMAIAVECVRADDVVPPDRRVGFIKLDLQGGELNALRGMPRLVEQADLMWIEYTGQPDLIEHIEDAGYLIFDTEYFGMGTADDAVRRDFDVTREKVVLSTGRDAWFGFRRKPWRNFPEEFAALRKAGRIVQTDLVCVNRRRLPQFLKMLGSL